MESFTEPSHERGWAGDSIRIGHTDLGVKTIPVIYLVK